MTEQEVILQHLTLYKISNGKVGISTLMAALRDARHFCNRHPRTGRRNRGARGQHGSWLGTIGYLILIDHIGKCFKMRGENRTQKDEFQAALRIFGKLVDKNLCDKEISALYALRCAFAHEYCLYNIPKNQTKVELVHHFTVCGGPGPLITFQKRWDQSLKTFPSLDQETWINLEKIQDLVEGIYRKLLELNEKNRLEVNLSDGYEALSKHYVIQFRKMLN